MRAVSWRIIFEVTIWRDILTVDREAQVVSLRDLGERCVCGDAGCVEYKGYERCVQGLGPQEGVFVSDRKSVV